MLTAEFNFNRHSKGRPDYMFDLYTCIKKIEFEFFFYLELLHVWGENILVWKNKNNFYMIINLIKISLMVVE